MAELITDSNDKNLQPSRYQINGDKGAMDPKTGKNNKQLNGLATTVNIGGENGYQVQSSSYPSDLFSNKKIYGGNYVLFYINVAEDSKILQQPGVKTMDPKSIPPRLRGDLAGQKYNSAQVVGGATTAGLTTGVGVQGVANAITGGGGGVKQVAESGLKTGAGALAASGTVTAASGGKMSRQQKRLSNAIALHVPNQLTVNYTMDWQADDTFAFQAGATAATEVTKAAATAGAKSNLLGSVGAIATNIALQTPGLGGALSSASGLASNPKKEQVFRNVNFREFTFDYQFSPRNSTEARNVREIIKLFKLHMHPEYKDLNNFVFIFPSEFDIYYYNGGQENMYLNRHTSCVLKGMNVNYTPQGAFNTFDDGMPTQINVQLQFLELAILTKETIMDGF